MEKIILDGLYSVTSDGRVFSLPVEGRVGHKKKIQLRPYTTARGYKFVKLFNQTHSIHRLVASEFVNNPNPSLYTQVNHKDGNKSNNNFENLEWCTPRQNIGHAIATGLKLRYYPNSGIEKKPVIVTKLSNGESTRYASIAEAARAIGSDKTLVAKIAQRKKSRYTANGYTVRFEGDNSVWTRPSENPAGKRLLTIDPVTKEERVFPSILEASKALEVSRTSIQRAIKGYEKGKLVKGYLLKLSE